MFRIIRLVICIVMFIMAGIFTKSAIEKMKPAIKTYPEESGGDSYTFRMIDIKDPGKGDYVLSYAIVAAACFIGGAVLLHSIRDKNGG